MSALPTSEDLQRVIAYDRETGAFTWVTPPRGKRVGARAGTRDRNGYVRVQVLGRRMLAHRLAWFLCTGAWPRGEIDHRNGDRADNAIANLREAGPAQNKQNRGAMPSNRAGLKGAHYRAETGRWKAEIDSGGKRHYLGTFDTAEQAHAAYCAAAARMHGEFARQR